MNPEGNARNPDPSANDPNDARRGPEAFHDVDAEAVEDLDVDEKAESVAGGDEMCSATPTICDTL